MEKVLKNNKHLLERNIKLYKYFMGFIVTPVTLPIVILFWQDLGLSNFQIYFIQGIIGLSIFFLEIPMGILADLFGQKRVLVLSALTSVVGITIHTFANSFLLVLYSQILAAASLSLLSGADSALVYDSLEKLNRQKDFAKINGDARFYQLISMAASSVIGGAIAHYDFRYAVIASAIGPFLAFLISLTFFEPNSNLKNEKELSHLLAAKKIFNESKEIIKSNKSIRWYMVFMAIVTTSNSWLLVSYQPYFKYIGLSTWMFGWIYAFFNIFAAYVSKVTYKFINILGVKGTLIASLSIQSLTVFLMALVATPLSFLFITGHQFTRGVVKTLAHSSVLPKIEEGKRATVLSVFSLFSQLLFGITSLMIGLLNDHFSLITSLLVQASIILVSFIFLFGFFKIEDH